MTQRAESGVYQFGDDWPGVFFRGDDAYGFASALEQLLEHVPVTAETVVWRAMAAGLAEELAGCDTDRNPKVTKLRPFSECEDKSP